MITKDGFNIQCEFCEAQIKNHRWGKIKSPGWFFTRDDRKAFCPQHVPEPIKAWRERNSS